MSVQTLFLSVLASSMTLTTTENPAALASIQMQTQYAFDDNVIAEIMVRDEKTVTNAIDPLSNLIFNITLMDKVDGSRLVQLNGSLFTGGGIDALDELHSDRLSYITSKLDFHGALASQYSFFDAVVTKYDPLQAEAVKAALTANGVMNQLGSYRINKKVLPVPASTVVDLTPEQIRAALLSMRERPRYLVTCEIDSLSNLEALVGVMDKVNGHLLIDIGDIDNWESAVAVTESINVNDHRVWVFWNPNRSRPRSAKSILGRKKWRPCVGDYLGQLLARNTVNPASGIPPIQRPIAGYDFPLAFRDMEVFDNLVLEDDAQNALANAGVNVVMNERFEGGDRWIYGDVLTQYVSDDSALRLINAAEIETYSTNGLLAIIKKHMLKPSANMIDDATTECTRFLDACVTAGLFVFSQELGDLYYAFNITPRGNSFDKVDVELSRRPEGCTRQVYYKGTITK